MFFKRLAMREVLERLSLHTLPKFMETYGQEAGFSAVQVGWARSVGGATSLHRPRGRC